MRLKIGCADDRVKRAKEKKTRRAKTIKQLTSMGRRHLLGVRVVMKNMVYVVGMKIPGSGDEVSRTSVITLDISRSIASLACHLRVKAVG